MTGRSAGSSAIGQSRDRPTSWSGFRAVACAAPTCISPRATCRPADPASPRDTRSSDASRRWVRTRVGSRSVNGSACRGWARLTVPVRIAGVVRRTCVARRPSPAGIATVATPTSVLSTKDSPTGCRQRWTTSMQRRCCAPASSVTGPGDPRTFLSAAGWASMGSVAVPTSPRRSRCTWASACTFSPGASTTRNWPARSASTPLAVRRTRRRNRSTGRSCSLRPASSSPSRCGPWIVAQRSRLPGSGSPTSRR